MDFFSHGLWTYLFFHRYRWRWLAVFFGLLPDLGSWFIYMVYMLFKSSSFGRPDLAAIPDWVFALYNVSHSLFVWIAFFLALWFIFGKPIWAVTGGMIAIVIDVFTHSRDFLPTPFLWPVSEWRFPGFSWGERWFMIINFVLLIVGYSYFIVYRRWKDKSSSKA